ncbi:hypothetical protein JCM19236_5346 [Vibrio sp. JCM 19236]|nr:hypothetical protein JCM19236_5346 [Vibrio sp. JCM 19236]
MSRLIGCIRHFPRLSYQITKLLVLPSKKLISGAIVCEHQIG